MRLIAHILLLPVLFVLLIVPSMDPITIRAVAGLYVTFLALTIVVTILHAIAMRVMDHIMERMPPVFSTALTGLKVSMGMLGLVGLSIVFMVPDTTWFDRIMMMSLLPLGMLLGIGIERLRIIEERENDD